MQLNDGAVIRSPRPSAPFAYTNIWGLNFACFLPFFLLSWCGKDAGWRRPVALPLWPLAHCHSVADRGLWAALIVSTLFLAVRSAQAGKVKLLAGLLAGCLVVAGVVVATPLRT